MTKSNPSNFGRGIDSIAHLFLSQTGRDMPHRRPPGSPGPSFEIGDKLETANRNPIPNDISDSDNIIPPNHSNNRDDIPQYGQDDNELIMGEIILAYHLNNSLEKVYAYAETVTQRDEKIALININNIEASLIPFGDLVETAQQQPQIISETEDIAGSLVPALNELARNGITKGSGQKEATLDNLLINIDRGFSPRIQEMARYCEYITIVTTCESDDVVEAYRVIKTMSIQLGPQHEIALFVCDAPDTETADEVYYKLAETTKKFLDRVLVPAGCSLKEKEISNTPTSSEYYEKVTDSEKYELTDYPRENSANVLPDPQEKHQEITPVANDVETSVNELDMEDMPAPQPAESVESSEPRSKAPVTQKEEVSKELPPSHPGKQARPIVLNSVRTNKLPQTNQELASCLLLSLPQWLKSLPTAMALPHGVPQTVYPDTHILIDAAGRLHIFIADLSADTAVLPGALNARKWLIDNLAMISASCNQLHIDLTLEPGLIFVATHNLETLKNSAGQLTDIPCKFYQVHYLQGSPGWSLLIVPT